jgi:hypothetical protein
MSQLKITAVAAVLLALAIDVSSLADIFLWRT